MSPIDDPTSAEAAPKASQAPQPPHEPLHGSEEAAAWSFLAAALVCLDRGDNRGARAQLAKISPDAPPERLAQRDQLLKQLAPDPVTLFAALVCCLFGTLIVFLAL